MGRCENRGEHHNDNVREDKVVPCIGRRIVDELSSGKGDVENKPYDGRRTTSAVGSSVVEHFGQSLANLHRQRVGNRYGNFVAQIHEVLLAK